MIFFVIDGRRRQDVAAVTDPAAFTSHFPTLREPRLVAWNEVFPLGDTPGTTEAMHAAVWDAARRDPLCQQVLARLDDTYQLDPFTDAPDWWVTAVRDTIDHWAHPRIGNISANWEAPPRRPVGPAAVEESWGSCTFLDDVTLQAIADMDQRLGPPTRSARDQVRICHHIVDLARAVVGEVSTYVPKRMEKLFALDLLSSDRLHDDLVALLTAAHTRTAIPVSVSVRQTEYCRYYFGGDLLDALDRSAGGIQARVLQALWDGVIGQAVTDPPAIIGACLQRWNKLPPVIRCAVLLNDVRKVLMPSAGTEFDLRATRMVTDTVYGFDTPSSTIPLAITAGQRARSGWRFVEHWTRDERHPATQSARRLLTPTWAGPSGHVAKNLHFFREFLGSQYPPSADRAIPAALFALWRLYYDRRYSPTHTLVETCEGTTANTDLSQVRRSLQEVGDHDVSDPYDLFRRAQIDLAPRRRSRTGRVRRRTPGDPHVVIDGVAIMEMLRRRHVGDVDFEQLHRSRTPPLQHRLDERRTALTSQGYVVPRWSHALEPDAVGVAAAPFTPPPGPVGRRRHRKAI